MTTHVALKSSVTELIKNNRDYYCLTPEKQSLVDLIAGYGVNTFKSLSSDSGVAVLKKAVLSSSINSYLSSKPELIVTLAAGFLGIFLALVYGIFVSTNFCGKRKKGEEKNSQNTHICEKLCPKKKKAAISVIILSVALLIALTITSIVIIFQTNSGINVSLCNTWQILGGYFFGAKEINVLPGVSNDWRGSFSQHESVSELLSRVIPTSEVTQKSQNILYNKVWTEFYGANGLKSKLERINERTQLTVMMYLLSSTAFASLVPVFDLTTVDIKINEMEIELVSGTLEYVETSVPLLLVKTVGEQMNNTMKLLETTFAQTLQSSLSNQAILIQEAKETANVSSIILEDSDYLMYDVTNMVNSASGLVTLGHSFIFLIMALSILALVIILFYIYGLFYYNKNSQNINLNSNLKSLKKQKLYEKVAHFGLLITASLLLLFGAFFISLSIGGSDTCTFVNEDLITNGEWSYLPAKLLESKSKTTNIQSILDVCLKSKGHGDIISNFGLRLLVEKLDHHAKALQEETIKVLEASMDKEANLNSLHSIARIIRSNAKMLVFKPTRLISRIQGNITKTPAGEEPKPDNTINWPVTAFPFDLQHISSDTLNGRFYSNSFQNIILTLFAGDTASIVSLISDIGVRSASEVKSMKAAIQTIELMFEKYGKTGIYKSVCPSYLFNESKCVGYVSKEIQEKEILILDGPSVLTMVEKKIEFIELTNQSPAKKFYNPFMVDTVINTVVNGFKASDRDSVGVFLELIIRMVAYDLHFSAKVSAVDIQKKIAELSNGATIPWNLLPSGNNFPGCIQLDKCTFRDLHLFFGAISEITASALLETTQSVTSAVETFVKSVVIQVTQEQVNLARSVLVDSNCQFLGSALRKTAVSDLCTNVFPNLISLGILSIFLAFTTTIIAFLFKIYWLANQTKIL